MCMKYSKMQYYLCSKYFIDCIFINVIISYNSVVDNTRHIANKLTISSFVYHTGS